MKTFALVVAASLGSAMAVATPPANFEFSWQLRIDDQPVSSFNAVVPRNHLQIVDLPGEMKLELAAPRGADTQTYIRLLKSEGSGYRILHEGHTGSPDSSDSRRTFAYLICGDDRQYMSPAPAVMPTCESIRMGNLDEVPVADAGLQCRVSMGKQSNDALLTILPSDGHFVFAANGPGFVDRDGALGIKVGWERLVAGSLVIGGRRLDGDAAPARAYMNRGYGEIGFQPSYLVFPTPGCWEITGRIDDHALRFVVYVEKVGKGPAWQYEGLPNDGFWYQTTL